MSDLFRLCAALLLNEGAYDDFKNATEDPETLSQLVRELVRKKKFKAADLFPNPHWKLPINPKLWAKAAESVVEDGLAFEDRRGRAHLNYGEVTRRWKQLVDGHYGIWPERGLSKVPAKDGAADVVTGSMGASVAQALVGASKLMRDQDKSTRSKAARLMSGARSAKRRIEKAAAAESADSLYARLVVEIAGPDARRPEMGQLYENLKQKLGESSVDEKEWRGLLLSMRIGSQMTVGDTGMAYRTDDGWRIGGKMFKDIDAAVKEAVVLAAEKPRQSRDYDGGY